MESWRELAGRVLMVGLPGPELDSATVERLKRLRPGGAILFARNLESPGQAGRLLATVRDLLPPPTLLALDQEGGRVSRLEPWIGKTPSAAALARAGEPAVRRFALATGYLLRALGFNLDFAPVVDLCDEHATNGIGDRAYGTDAQTVTRMAETFLSALQETGVAGCLKHFPGLGPTNVDSHVSLPTSLRTRDELERADLVPYARLAARAACVMVGHGHFPGLDATADLPATLSHKIVHELLRTRLAYDGLVVTDDLEMGAVASLDRDGAAALQTIEAGCDLLLYCHRLELAETAADALATRAQSDSIFAARLSTAAQKVEATAQRWNRRNTDSTEWPQALNRMKAAAVLT